MRIIGNDHQVNHPSYFGGNYYGFSVSSRVICSGNDVSRSAEGNIMPNSRLSATARSILNSYKDEEEVLENLTSIINSCEEAGYEELALGARDILQEISKIIGRPQSTDRIH